MIVNVGTRTNLGVQRENIVPGEVTFETSLSQSQIEELSNNKQAVQNRVYIATDGGIYVGNADGTVRECADITIWD